MKTNLLTMVAVASMLSLASCATLFTKSAKEVTFKGLPGTTIKDKDRENVVAEIGQNGFATAKLKKQLKSKHIEASKEGYQPKDYVLDTKIQGAFWGNLVFGGIPGGVIDAVTGKMKTYKDDLVDVTLTETVSSPAEVVPPMALERVDRNNPGATSMEKAIIRWFFDSDPRGARIFYRVISSVPAEVKNTNEAYLSTTPIEETRSFNIPGLTLENASDVTIEVKVSKRGYHDQIKRFNARQALDQQEISGFFELVPSKN